MDADSRAATVRQRPSSRRVTPAEISVSRGRGQTHLRCLHFWGGVHLRGPPLQGWLRGTPRPLPGTCGATSAPGRPRSAECWVALGASGRLCAGPVMPPTLCLCPPAPPGHSQGHRLLWPAVHQARAAPSVPRPLLAGPAWVAGAGQQHVGTSAWGVWPWAQEERGWGGGHLGAWCPGASMCPPRLPQSLFERQGLPGPEKLPGSLRKGIPRTKSVGTAGLGSARGRGGTGLKDPPPPLSPGASSIPLSPPLPGPSSGSQGCAPTVGGGASPSPVPERLGRSRSLGPPPHGSPSSGCPSHPVRRHTHPSPGASVRCVDA